MSRFSERVLHAHAVADRVGLTDEDLAADGGHGVRVVVESIARVEEAHPTDLRAAGMDPSDEVGCAAVTYAFVEAELRDQKERANS